MSSDSEDYLNSADVNEEFSFDEGVEGGEAEGEGYFGDSGSDGEEQDGEFEEPKYSEELEYEDVGEPSTFNFHIHNGEPVYSLDFLQGTELLATGAGDDRALLVDARGLEVLADLGSAGDSVISVKFFQSTGGNDQQMLLLATASMDGIVRIYANNPETGIELKAALAGPGEGIECNWIDWHSKGPILIAGFADGSVWMWNVLIEGDKAVMAIFAGHVTTPATSGTFTPDGKLIIVGSEEGTVLVNSPKDPATPLAKIVPLAHQESALRDVTHVAVHPGSQIFMAGDSEGHLRVYKAAAGPQSMPLNDLSVLHRASIESIGFHPLGSLAFSASMDGQTVIYDASFTPRHILTTVKLFASADSETENNTDTFTVETDGFSMAKWLAAMPNGPALDPSLSFAVVLGTAQGRLAIVEARSGQLLRRLRGRPGRPVLDASVSAGGILAVAFDDGIIALYQL